MGGHTDKTTLVVEDARRLLDSWARTLRRFGWSVDTATSIARVKKLIAAGKNWQVVLLDLIVDDGNTVCLIPELAGLQPAPAIAVVSNHLDAKTIVGDLRRCAVTIPKPASGEHVAEILEVLRRKYVPWESTVVYCFDRSLSDRESEVVQIAAEGASNSQIAEKLGISLGTLSTHWQRIFKKTGCHSREQVLLDVYEFRLRM